MKLTDSDFAHLVKWAPDGLGKVATSGVADADGVIFQCPVDGHGVLIWFAGRPAVPSDARPLPRWTATGHDLSDLTLHPSVSLEGHATCNWHGWVTAGEAK